MKTSHACPHCKGKGVVELTGVYAETLAMLRSTSGPITGASLARESGCKATAMNNRLAVLERLGYASSERHGRERRFRAIVKKGGQS